jgi:hypothetical protein
MLGVGESVVTPAGMRTDPKTGEKTVRERKSGGVIWHDKGEDAPVLKNVGSRPYRTLTIELK